MKKRIFKLLILISFMISGCEKMNKYGAIEKNHILVNEENVIEISEAIIENKGKLFKNEMYEFNLTFYLTYRDILKENKTHYPNVITFTLISATDDITTGKYKCNGYAFFKSNLYHTKSLNSDYEILNNNNSHDISLKCNLIISKINDTNYEIEFKGIGSSKIIGKYFGSIKQIY